MSIHGTFYFTKTKSGNLLGEFINNGLKNFIVESANIDEGFCKEKFEAEYVTNWLEDEKTFTERWELNVDVFNNLDVIIEDDDEE